MSGVNRVNAVTSYAWRAMVETGGPAMAYYVVDGHAVESCGRLWVDNARAARVLTEVVPIAMCDGDADGMPVFTAWVPPEHAPVDDSRESDSKAI